jgi:hypothetical protein
MATIFPWAMVNPKPTRGCPAGVAADGSGFRGFTLSPIVRSDERVDAVLAEAKRAGGPIAGPAQRAD